MPTTPIQVFDIATNRLDPAFDPDYAKELGANLAASLTWPRGQVLAESPSTPGTFVKYSETEATAAGGAPTLSTPTGGALPVGDYTVRYRYVNAYGLHSKVSAAATTTAALNDKVHVAAVTPLPAGAVSVDWYVSATAGDATHLFKVLNNDGSAADLPVAAGTEDAIPATTEYNWFATGTYPAKRILRYACVTDSAKNITIGSGDADPIVTQPDVDTWIRGIFKSEELFGMTSQALADLGGHILSGDLTTGVIIF
jgi:hypothetical protein